MKNYSRRLFLQLAGSLPITAQRSLWAMTDQKESASREEGVPGKTDPRADEALGKACVFAYYPSLRKLAVKLDLPSAMQSDAWERYSLAAVTIRDNDRKSDVVHKQMELSKGAGESLLDLPALADGTYELRVALGESGPFTAKQFEHKNFPWLGNKLGTSREVYPPYQPILVEGREARVVLRSYRMNDLGLWDSVVSEGRELLAAPVTLHVSTDEGEERWQSTAGQWVSVEPDRAVYKAEAKTGAVQVHTVSTIEYDGCMRVEMELLPGRQRRRIRRLWLEIPIADREAPLFHYVTMEGIRRNYAGATPRGGKITWISPPEGTDDPDQWRMVAYPPLWKAEPGGDDGILWTCRDTSPWKRVSKTDFVPYIWLGGGERGIAWFGDNPRGYVLDSTGTMQVLERAGEKLILRVDLVNRPWVPQEGRKIVFGLQASPTRPMPEGWRSRVAVPALPIGDMACWGGHECSDKYPDGHDFRVVDEIMKVRRTCVLDPTVFATIDQERPAYWKRIGTQDRVSSPRTSWLDWVIAVAMVNLAIPQEAQNARQGVILGAVMSPYRYHVDGAAGEGPPDNQANPVWLTVPRDNLYPEGIPQQVADTPLAIYFEEHASDIATEEWIVYQDEWRAMQFASDRNGPFTQLLPENNFKYGHQGCPVSYRDFTLWYANEWMKRGISIYLDNVFLETDYNTMTSAAYVSGDGDIQPAAPLWDQREYYKRLWVLEQEWNKKLQYPIMITHHRTNTLMLPLHTWSDASLDLEWWWYGSHAGESSDPHPFPADFLLAESASRQIGGYPHILYSVLSIPDNLAFKSPPDPQMVGAEWGMRMVHEGMRWLYPFENRAAFEPARSFEKKLWEFGYGTEDVAVMNYWSDDPALTVSDPETKWLLLARRRDAKLLLVLQSYRKGDVEVTVELDPRKLGFAPSLAAKDVETGKTVVLVGTQKPQLKIPLPGLYGTKVLVIGSEA
jgi:hypothetical protein